MNTHINTINAIKGLTCAIDTFKYIEQYLKFKMKHPIKHLTDAATEMERLNNENIKLQGEITKLKEGNSPHLQAQADRFREHWSAVIDTITATDAGRGLRRRGMDIDIVTDKALAIINKIEADRKEALRIAEAFQKAKSEANPSKDINVGWFNYNPFETSVYSQFPRLPGKATYEKFTQFNFISTELINEAMRASEIHPKWPTDAVHAVSILTEESGELMKAAIEYHYNNGDIEAIREEAIQTGAMALRVLMDIDKYKRPSDEK